ncbi:hypothetical protein GXW74_20630 [Roseomonas eburnea]|uniref:Phasin domain-containing protein n=1 Tax=Neoroseomonas eburnea TaxID=1346889 RepID=A0A9X9XGS4_9PROT|nr:hypothetical protein [Neoroseomonas eburnea]MBR0682910.1 hypothetical protein [Neoroseomonas eburnea]
MHEDTRAPTEPGDHRRLDPVALTMDVTTQVQAIASTFAAAQAGAVQETIDRLAAHGQRIAQARHPLSVMAIQMECCVTLIEAASAPFRAALRAFPQPPDMAEPAMPTGQPPSVPHGTEQARAAEAPRRPARAGDGAGASARPAAVARSE